MFLGLTTLSVAILISIVAAYYSVLGLTSIFAAAFWPVVIMGGALETGKVVAAVWLHRNWKRASLSYKLYLVPALVFLMLLTSMGIFGFLSKAHLDQAVPTGDVAAKVSLLDEKIRTQKDNIDAARKALTQMDAAVDQTMARSSDEKGADKATALRRSQARERSNLQNDIGRAQAEIAKLNEQRAPIASELRKVEAEVGPIKYVAALIYGDNPDQNLLEASVRWVIILIVLVFDPLAIVLILAGSKQIEWTRGIDFAREDHHREVMRGRELEKEEKSLKNLTPVDALDVDHANSVASTIPPDLDVDVAVEQAMDLAATKQRHEDKLVVIEEEIKQKQHQIDQTLSELSTAVEMISVLDQEISDSNGKNESLIKENQELQQKVENLEILVESLLEQMNSLQQSLTESKTQEILVPTIDGDATSPEKFGIDRLVEAKLENKQDVEQDTQQNIEQDTQQNIHIQQDIKQDIQPSAVVEVQPNTIVDQTANTETVNQSPQVTIEEYRPEMLWATADDSDVNISNAGFGTKFSSHPAKGDLFLRVDYLPSKLFKWNGYKWIEIDKRLTDSYTYNDQYIKHLIDKLEKGEYDADDLSDNERSQIDDYIKRNLSA